MKRCAPNADELGRKSHRLGSRRIDVEIVGGKKRITPPSKRNEGGNKRIATRSKGLAPDRGSQRNSLDLLKVLIYGEKEKTISGAARAFNCLPWARRPGLEKKFPDLAGEGEAGRVVDT